MNDEPRYLRVYGADGIDEVLDSDTGYAMESRVRSRHPSNACAYCGKLHETDRMGWRNHLGEKVPCDTCRREP